MKNSSYEKAITTQYIGTPFRLRDKEPAWVIELPRSITHIHTYGLLTPFFQGLIQSKLMATKCINSTCPHPSVWLPPRADCPDCYERMQWIEVPSEGTVYSFTLVEYSGIGIEMSTPYWQIDVLIKGVDTIFKGYLESGKPEMGMKVKAKFRTKEPTYTILDICWVPN